MKKFVSGWRYARHGPISAVMKLEKYNLCPQGDDAIVQVLAAPLHRLDAAIVSGALGQQHSVSFPRVSGFEGVGQVIHKGSGKRVKEGDMVWISPCTGTWASEISVSENLIHKINPLHRNLAVTASNLLLAHHLLKSFRNLQSGDTVIQNGGSSLTSLAVSALGSEISGLKIFTAASSGDRFAGAQERHQKYGSEVVEYSASGVRSLQRKLERCGAALLLNAVGGAQLDGFLKLMKQGSDVVSFGAQNGAGLFLSGSNFVFPETTLQGFLLHKHLSSQSYEERQADLDSVLSSLSKLDFTYPFTSAGKLDELPTVWDEAFVKGGMKGVLALASS